MSEKPSNDESSRPEPTKPTESPSGDRSSVRQIKMPNGPNPTNRRGGPRNESDINPKDS